MQIQKRNGKEKTVKLEEDIIKIRVEINEKGNRKLNYSMK